MRQPLKIVKVAVLWFIVLCSAAAQQSPQPQRRQPWQQQAQSPLPHQSPGSKLLYQRRDTWYEFLLKQFNPGNLDYGKWIEQRRQAFLDASVRNPYFGYTAGLILSLLLMLTAYAKQRIDHRRSMWITAEMMADLHNHDMHSRRVARDAIQKYNDHIERCNRAVEAGERGVFAEGMESEVERFRAELQSVTSERDAYKRERDLAKADLAEKERLLADMSFRLDALAKKSNGNRAPGGGVDVRTADQKLVQHINNLQEQLYVEKRENKRLKGE
jgi:hypothetical protein